MDTAENERRTFNRYSYDGAIVKFIEGRNFGLVKKYSKEYEMKDISRSGICFELDQYRGPGVVIDMIVDIPGKPNLHLRGDVRWVTEVNSSAKYEVGILFAPYGSRKEYNSFRIKDKLKQILEKSERH